MKTRTALILNSMTRSRLRYGLLLIPLVLATLALSPTAQAQLSPPPDGGYDGNNTAEGTDALFSLTTGTDNTALGFDALYSNTEGVENTATGSDALTSNTTGIRNTAHGLATLESNTTGSYNTATGRATLESNTTGSYNTATGRAALESNTTGSYNTADGYDALFYNSTGIRNTATGSFALIFNTTGNYNTADGYGALNFNTTGNYNTANGYFALYQNTSGNNSTASGYNALLNNTTGNDNIALGNSAGSNLTTGDNNIDIGNTGLAAESGVIRIGTAGTQTATFIAGIRETPIAHGAAVPVGITPDGQLGVKASSARFKEAIKPMDKTSEAILALKPVTFHYKKELDPDGTPQFGLVAEDVAKVNPDLIARDAEGKIFTVRYDAVNAMLLNEFLKEHRKVQKLQSNTEEQQKEIKALAETVREQALQLQKVSVRIEISKPARQLVSNRLK